MRYFAKSKFSGSLVHKKNFSLIWQVVFKSGYVRVLSREVGYLLNELGEKSRATIILGKFVNKQKWHSHWLFFIGQNLKHVHMTYSFLELLTFFCLTLEVIWVYFSPHQRNIVREYKLHGKPIMKYLAWTYFWYWSWKNPIFWCKTKTRYE